MLSADPGARAVERAWLLYTPVWGAITGVVMLGGFAEHWGDTPLMLFGVVLALGALVAPWVASPAAAADRASARRHASAMSLATVVLAFGLNYFQTPYFFDVLHMRYGFRASWMLEHNPLFLYLVTIPYFATYSALACVAVRFARSRAPWLGRAVYAVVPFALALLETLLNANPFMTRLFCYDDLPLMLWFGTLSYGVSFVLALPVWMALAEPPRASDGALSRAIRRAWVGPLVAMAVVVLADALVLAAVRVWIAPAVTTVVEGATGGHGGCLGEPEDAGPERESTGASVR